MRLTFDNGTIEQPSIILSTRYHKHLGQIVNVEGLQYTANLNGASEISFVVHKFADGVKERLWDEIYDLRYVYINFGGDSGEYYQIQVSLDESTEDKKTINGVSAYAAELSQINLYNFNINNENDKNWNEKKKFYPSTLFYQNADDIEKSKIEGMATVDSLLDRILTVAPNYRIKHVDPTLHECPWVKSFSIDGSSVYDFLTGDVSKEYNCIFRFDSVNREISVYDIYTVCMNDDCSYRAKHKIRYRGEFSDFCPECGSSNVKYFGKDTTIFVSSENLTDQVQFTTDTDKIKTCFRLEAGDDLMTTSVMMANPNGSNRLYYFSPELKHDMPNELVEKLDSYDELYNMYLKEYAITMVTLDSYKWSPSSILFERPEYSSCSTRSSMYNAIVNKYKTHFSQLNEYERINTLPSSIIGHDALSSYLYETINLRSFLESAMMPSVEIADTNATTEGSKLTVSNIECIALTNAQMRNTTSKATVENALMQYARAIVKIGFVKLEIIDSSICEYRDVVVNNVGKQETQSVPSKWKGKFVVTNYSDKEDVYVTSELILPITYAYYGDSSSSEYKSYIEKYIKQVVAKTFREDLGGEVDYDVLSYKHSVEQFTSDIKKYSYVRLQSFSSALTAALTVLVDYADKDSSDSVIVDMYNQIYLPYYQKSIVCERELTLRKAEMDEVSGDAYVDEYGHYSYDGRNQIIYATNGMQQILNEENIKIQDALNLKDYIGNDLYSVFNIYIREDDYKNSNYITDTLSSSEIMKQARQLLEKARKDLVKSGLYQHSISANLNNLLAIEEFAPIKKYFELGNWIRVGVDDNIYRLRLISYSVNYDDALTLSTNFSDVTQTADGVNDIQSILSSAKSMSTSYGGVSSQAEKGNDASTTVTDFVKRGLDSGLAMIKNNTNEEVSFDSSGIIARKFDDITNSYSDEQLRITHNILCFTEDNWQSTSLALGKHDYYYFNGGVLSKSVGYGLTAQFVTAGYINGSQIIAGDIYSSNYSRNGDSYTGNHFDLNNSNFVLADGKIVYSSGVLNLRNVVIDFNTSGSSSESLNTIFGNYNNSISSINDSVGDLEDDIRTINETTIPDTVTSLTSAYKSYSDSAISGLDQKVAGYLTAGGKTSIGIDYIISPYIGGGYLNISSGNKKVLIDPGNLTKNSYIFQVHNGSEITVGIDANGNASFKGAITATSLTLSSGASVPSSKVDGLSDVATSGKYSDLSGSPTIPTMKQETNLDGSVVTTFNDNSGHEYTYTTYDAGTYLIVNRGVNSDKGSFVVSKEGLLTANNALIYGTVHATNGSFAGKISATSGFIGSTEATGWNIGDHSIYNTLSSINATAPYEGSGGTYVGTDGIRNTGTATIITEEYQAGFPIYSSTTKQVYTTIKDGCVYSNFIQVEDYLKVSQIKMLEDTIWFDGRGIIKAHNRLVAGFHGDNNATGYTLFNTSWNTPEVGPGHASDKVSVDTLIKYGGEKYWNYYISGGVDYSLLDDTVVQTVFMFDAIVFHNRDGSGFAPVYARSYEIGSDIRYKDVRSEWMNRDISKSIITSITPIAYDYTNGTGGHHRGFSAQEIKEVLDKNNLPEMLYSYNENSDMYTLNMQELIPDMVNCIQDLYEEIERLKGEKTNG